MSTGLEKRLENSSRGRSPSEKQSDRRHFLKIATAALLPFTLVSAAEKTSSADPNKPSNLTLATSTRKPNPKQYKTYGLEGWSLGEGFKFTGIQGKVGPTANIDFKYRLDELWEEKMKKYGYPEVVRQAYDTRVAEYRDQSFTPTTMSINKYLGHAKASIEEVKKHINWKEVKKLRRLNNKKIDDNKKIDLLRKIAESLTEKDLLAYALTEIMPTQIGKVNVAAMDFLLRTVGREYVELIPAMADRWCSFGPYQWTQWAIYDNGEQRGASIINQALPQKHRIPGSVIYQEGNHHHKAAYLFAICNLADLIKELNDKQLNTLKNASETDKQSIVEFIATAHHNPEKTRPIAKKWLDRKAKDRKADYKDSCYGRFKPYATKTIENYKALQKVRTDSNIDTVVNRTNKRDFRIKYEEPTPTPEQNKRKRRSTDANETRTQRPIDPKNIQSSFTYYGAYSETWHAFTYTVQYGDNPSLIANRFNKEYGHMYRRVGTNNVKTKLVRGNKAGSKIDRNDSLYIVAEPLKLKK